MKEDCNSSAGWQTQIRISIFSSATHKTPKPATIGSVLEEIRNGTHAEQIKELRQILSTDIKRYKLEKKRLPAFTTSGTAKNRREIEEHSGLLMVDFDNLGEKLQEIRAQLINDPHTAFLFTSPSGQGLKTAVRIDPSRHLESFQAAEKYYREHFGLSIDPVCKDKTRLCFVSYDPDLWINPKPVRLEIGENEGIPLLNSSESCVLNPCVPEPLNPYVSTSLHNIPDALENLKSRDDAVKRLVSQQGALARLYAEFIEDRFYAHAGERNGFLTHAVPFLYRAVEPKFVLILVGHFYDCNRAKFNDPREQHMKEAQAMLKGVAQTYVNSLEERERQVYEAIGEAEQPAFRIFRDLAFHKNPEREPLTFYMSFNHLADRLGIHPMQAQRIMRRLEGCRVIATIEKGMRWSIGVRGKAGSYRWLVSMPQIGQTG